MDKVTKIIKNTFVFLAIFLVINYVMQSCQTKEKELISSGNLVFSTTDTEYSRHQTVTVNIVNNSKEAITIPNECPGEPFDVYQYTDDEWVKIAVSPELSCEDAKDIVLDPGQETKILYDNWNYSLFSKMGRFKIGFNTTIEGEEKNYNTNEFLVTKEGIFRQIAVKLFYRPIYNGLIFLTSVMPNHDLGLAIILLTILIRTILLLPSQKAMKSQKRMQDLQPRLEKIKEKHKGDQQKIAMETMALWKEAKINPFSSCLPLILQFPFLIALFYVIQGGLNPDKVYLLYTTYGDLRLQDIDVHFFGIMNLMKNNLYVLPLVVGGLQFIQMQMMANKKKPKDGKMNEMAMATNMMTYIMPVMIAVFTASLPAGVGLYWGTSTLYGIAQQYFVNKGKVEKDPNEPTVKVIEPKASKK